ncbi:hypothetical protein B7P43_G08658, partial [Cryptotermes secundus]
MSQQDHGAKSGGSEPPGSFGDHGVGQRSVIGGASTVGHDGFGAQHGFGSSSAPNQDSKSGPAFGGSVPSIQDPKMLQCGPNRGLSDFGSTASQPDCSVLGGNFGVPPPSLVQQDLKGMPAALNQGSGDFGDSPVPQKPSNMVSPTHSQQLTLAPKSSGDEKTITEGEIQSDEKDKSNNTGKLDFTKNAADGIPGLDLLAERDKQNDAKSTAEERELSVGHDIDERNPDVSLNPGGFIGPVPAPTSTEQQNDQGLGRQGFGTSRPPSIMPFQQSNIQGFGPDSKGPLNNQGFQPGSQNSPNVQGPFNQGSNIPNLGIGGNKNVSNNENQPNPQNFGPGAQGPNQSYGIGNQGPNQSFGPGFQGPNQSFNPGNQGFNQSVGPGNQESINPQGFGPQNSMGSRRFGSDGNQGFGPGNQSHSFGPGNRGYGPKNQSSSGMGIHSNNQGFGSNNFGPQNNQCFGPDRFGGAPGPQPWGDGLDGCNRGGWNQGPSRFDGPGKDNSQGMMDNFQGPRDSFQDMRDNFQGQRDNFLGPMDRPQGPRDNFQGPRDNFFGSRDSFHGPRDNYQGLRDGYQGPRDGGFPGPRDNFPGPGDRFLGPRDNFGGPREAFQGPRDNFQGPKDRFSGPPFGDFGHPGESEFGRGGSHDFPPPQDFQQEGGRGGPQDHGFEYGRGRGGRGRAR